MRVKIKNDNTRYCCGGNVIDVADAGDVVDVPERVGDLLVKGKQATKVRETTANKTKLETS